MALKIKWSPTARRTYENVLQYLQNAYTEKEVDAFILRTERVLKVISIQPLAFRQSSYKNIRLKVITKQTSIIYRVSKSGIYLLRFWDNRQDPAKRKY